MTHLLLIYGLILLFVLVAIEGAGVPLPGETALIAAALLAANGHYSIVSVIVVASAGAIAGDNTGYWLGRKGGRAVLERTPIARTYLERVLPRAEVFFQRHGAKTVFIARFVALLRFTASWTAGMSRMRWLRFAIFDAAGGTLWATGVALIAYEFGRAAVDAIDHYGFIGSAGVAIVFVIAFLIYRFSHKRVFVDR